MTHGTDDREPKAHGWDAIDARLRPIYGDQQPRHWGTIVDYRLGGPDPMDGISAYKRLAPSPHWHFITYGFSELYEKETDNLELSGYGFELTLRVSRVPEASEPPLWPVGFLNNLARYVFTTGNVFAPGDHMNLNGPIALDSPTLLTGMAVTADPELSSTATPNGRLAFLQVVGLTTDEYEATLTWNTDGLLDLLKRQNPLLITALERASLLAGAEALAEVVSRTQEEGSSTEFVFNDATRWDVEGGLFKRERIVITIGARPARQAATILPGRLPHDRPFSIVSSTQRVTFVPGAPATHDIDGDELRLTLPASWMPRLCSLLRSPAGDHALPGLDRVVIRVVPSVVRDSAGNIIEEVR